MTNLELNRKAGAIIEEVLEKTAEEYLRVRIEEPIEKAASSFEFDRNAPVTHQSFAQVTRDFVRHVYQRSLGCRQELSEAEAQAEAVAILEEGYQAPHGQGYYAAFLDASNPNLIGLEHILEQMARHITLRARTRHIRWICASRMELSDWPTRRLIAEILIQRSESFMPQTLRGSSPEQLAYHLTDLTNLETSANRIVSTLRTSNIDLPAF